MTGCVERPVKSSRIAVKLLQRRGYQLSDIDIEDIDFTLPASRSTQDKFFKPEDGKPASDFLRTLS